MSLLWSWDEMNVRVKLLADNVWVAEVDKTFFLSVGANISESIILVRTINFLAYGANEYYKTKIREMRIIEKTHQIEIWDMFNEWSKYYVWLHPPPPPSQASW